MAKSIADIEAVVLKYYPLRKSKPEELKGNKKTWDLAKVRNVTAYVAKESGIQFVDIASYYNQKHSSVMSAHRRLKEELSVTKQYSIEVNQILTEVQ